VPRTRPSGPDADPGGDKGFEKGSTRGQDAFPGPTKESTTGFSSGTDVSTRTPSLATLGPGMGQIGKRFGIGCSVWLEFEFDIVFPTPFPIVRFFKDQEGGFILGWPELSSLRSPQKKKRPRDLE